MIMIKLRTLHDNERYTVLKESKQSFYSTKNSLIINLKEKLQKPFNFFLKCQTRHISLAYLMVEIRGFELRRNWSIQLR